MRAEGDAVRLSTGGELAQIRLLSSDRDRQVTRAAATTTETVDVAVVCGYAAVFEHAYEAYQPIMGLEVISRGAFAASLAANPSLVFRFEHAGLPLASTQAGTLVVVENEVGLHYTAELDLSNPLAVSIVTEIARGSLSGASFEGRLIRAAQVVDEPYHRLEEISLDRGDISVVTYGQNPAAVTELVSRADTTPTETETETVEAEYDAEADVVEPVEGGERGALDSDLMSLELGALELTAPVGASRLD